MLSKLRVLIVGLLCAVCIGSASAYSLKFNANGGKIYYNGKYSSSITIKVSEKDTIISTPTATRLGYTFLGWYTKKSGGQKAVTPFRITGSTVLYAHWGTLCSVTFDANGGKIYNSGVYLSKLVMSVNSSSGMATVNSTPTATRSGYTFLGWYTTKSGGQKIVAPFNVAGKITLYAQWVKTYAITYDANGGVIYFGGKYYSVKSFSGYSGKIKINSHPSVSRTGYTFLGWYTAKSGGKKVTTPVTVKGAIKFYARWVKNTYLIMLDPNGGQVYNNGKYYSSPLVFTRNTETTTIKQFPQVKRLGYTFKGWYTAKTGGYRVYAPVSYDRTTTLYARWTIAIK